MIRVGHHAVECIQTPLLPRWSGARSEQEQFSVQIEEAGIQRLRSR
jgi:hypothetical protein